MPYVERAQSPAKHGTMLAYVEAYLEQLTVRHFAKQSIEYKRMALNRFIEWLQERGVQTLTDVTRPMLQRYQRHLYYSTTRGGRALSAAGQANRLAAVRGLFKYLTQQNFILYNPASELELPKPSKSLPKDVLSAEEAERVLSQPDIETPLGLRDRAILEVLYSTGIRRAELINLEQSDLNLGQQVLAVRQGKGRKDRFVPIGERALVWTQKYLSDIRPQLETSDLRTLFLDAAGRKMDPHQLSRAVQRYVQQSGVNKKGRCHLFRHTMATLMLENGADIRFIQDILGHTQLSTTEIYTRVSIHKLKEVHRLTHPARLQREDRADDHDPAPGAAGLLDKLAAEAED